MKIVYSIVYFLDLIILFLRVSVVIGPVRTPLNPEWPLNSSGLEWVAAMLAVFGPCSFYFDALKIDCHFFCLGVSSKVEIIDCENNRDDGLRLEQNDFKEKEKLPNEVLRY